MAFGYASNSGIDIDDIITTIITELVSNGNWTELDDGYDVVQDPDGTFDMYLSLEADNYRYIQVQIGENGTWDTEGHSMGDPKIEFGIIIKDHADGATATDEGIVKIGYDDDYCFFITDYTSIDSDHQRCFSYAGLGYPYKSSDECLVGGSTFFDGTPSPTNTASVALTICMMRDISDQTNKPIYYMGGISAAFSSSSGSPRGLMYSAKSDYRYLTPILLTSAASYPTNGENAGIRARLQDVYMGFYDDSYSHGTTLTASDDKEYELFIQDDTINKNNLPIKMWFRTA